MRLSARLLFSAAAFAACLASSGCHSVESPPNAAASPKSVPALEAASGDASSPEAAVTSAAKEIDLLHSVACVVAVSSKVDNPKDFPEHLVDGKLETAWNGRTGDLKGYIAFRTPAVTRVRRVSLTVGFDRGELFTKNHRIAKVRLSRAGKTLLERDLNPDARGFQDLTIDEAGGDFKLEVLETKAGTEKGWRELVVSELRVFGYANGAPENPTHLPELALGSLDGAPPRREALEDKPKAGPFPSVAELCLDYTRAMSKPIDAAFPGDRYPGKIGPVHCAPVKEAAPVVTGQGSPFRSAIVVRVNDPERENARLVLETAKGFALTSVKLWSRYHDDPGCGHASEHSFEDAKLVTGARGRTVLVLRTLATDVYWLGATDPGGTVERAYACDEDEAGAARCEGPLVTARTEGWPPGWDVASGQFPKVDADKLVWTFRKPPALGPAGDLRLGP